jgi:hypothetical protein
MTVNWEEASTGLPIQQPGACAFPRCLFYVSWGAKTRAHRDTWLVLTKFLLRPTGQFR